MLTHRNLVTNAANIIVAVGYASDSVYLHAPPMFHLADGASTLAVTMLGGAHVFIPRFDPAAVAAAVAAGTRDQHAAGAHHDQLRWSISPAWTRTICPRLAMVPFGASPMPDAVLQRATERLPACRFLHVYGMTEAAPLVTALEPRDALVPGRAEAAARRR